MAVRNAVQYIHTTYNKYLQQAAAVRQSMNKHTIQHNIATLQPKQQQIKKESNNKEEEDEEEESKGENNIN